MKVYSGSEIRNVAVVGHNDTGKTTLVSQLLFNAGAATRMGRVEDGTTVTDFDPDEVERKHSISAAIAFAEWKDTKINLIDTPGFGIFIMEARGALRVADAAVVGVPSVEWGETPVAFVVPAAGAPEPEALRAWANERLGKTQRLAGLRFLGELPRSEIGKVLKRELRDRWTDG